MDLVVNGKRHRVNVEPDVALLYVLRDHLDLTGAKYGCGEGQCGACTVLVDGIATRSCVTPASAVSGKQVLTIEGLADAGRLHPVQESFIACDAMQCGYCTPGMILSSVALLRKTPSPSDGEIKQALEGNICRCGTYNRIVSAVRQASQSMKTASRESDHA
jgi:aerobic-type carbon monoxide dehydrogenase small subunit (CoxS/CutS family)